MKLDSALGDTWSCIRDDKTNSNWMLVAPASDGKSAELVGKGSDGLKTFVSFLDDKKVLFGGFRCRAVDDRGTTKSVRAKFVFVTWLGGSVSAVQRARCGTLRSEFQRLFDGNHISIQTSDLDDLSEQALVDKLQSSTGAHKPTGYEFDGNDNQSGLTTGLSSSSAPAPVEKKTEAPQEAPKKATGTSGLKPADLWEEIKNDKTTTKWMIATYDGKDVSSATVQKQGTSGLDGLIKAFEPDIVQFAGLKCKAIDDRGSIKSIRNKFIFISWVGPNVKPMLRAKVSAHKVDFQQRIITGSHISVHTCDVTDLNEKDLIQQLQSSTGAHKPTGYDFSGSDEKDAAPAPAEEKKPEPVPAKPVEEPKKEEPKKEEPKAEEKKEEPKAKEEAPAPAPAAPAKPAPKAGGAPPPPPPPMPADFMERISGPKNDDDAKQQEARAALFKQLAQGTDITKGLRKVNDSDKRHKNRDENEVGKVTDFEELERKKAARQEELEKKKAAAAGKVVQKKEQKIALEGKAWKYENVCGTRMDKHHEKLDDANMTHSIHVTDCENMLLEITASKINSVICNDCKNVGIMMKGVVSSVEVSKGMKIEIQATEKLPSFILDRCNEVMLYTTKESRDVEITSCASTCINVTFTDEKDDEADPIEKPLPEQFVTRITYENGVPKMKTVPMEHAG